MSSRPHPAVGWRHALLGGPPSDEDLDEIASPLAPSSRLVGCALAQHVNVERLAWPGADLLALRTGLSDRAVREHLGRLAEAGFLELVEQGGRPGGPRASKWRVALPGRPWDPAEGWLTPSDLSAVDSSTPANPSGVTPDDLSAVSDTTPEVDAPTLEDDALTPDESADELEELDELGRGADRDRLVSERPDEVGPALAALVAIHGRDAVDSAVDQLVAARTKFRYTSQLRRAVEQTISSSTTPAGTPKRYGPSSTARELETFEDDRGRVFVRPGTTS